MAIRILIADDHSVVRQGLKMFLALDPELEVIGEAENGAEAVKLAGELRPDVVLMDLLMPVMDGIETLANGRSAVKIRVRAIAEGGEANRAVIELLARALHVPKSHVRVLSGATSRLKQVAVDGDPKKLGDALQLLTNKS